MWNCSRIFANKVTLLGLVAIGFLLLPTESIAQEENTKKPFEKPVLEEPSPLVEAGAAAPLPVQKPTPAKQTFPMPTPRKETHTTATIQEKELKKNETPSTLSFNIFLYIVDKFKAD